MESPRDPFKHRLEGAIRRSATVEDDASDPELELIRGMVDTDTWRRVENLQETKHDVLAQLLAWRKRFWAEGDKPSESESTNGSRKLLRREDGTFETYLKGGEQISLTEGEVFAASTWGVWWHLDKSVPRDLQRKIMSHQVRSELSDLYNQQLLAFGAADRLSDPGKRGAYERKGEGETSLDIMPNGILAEKMLFSCLIKAMHDGELPFTVESVDVYEDIEHKIDFIVTYRDVRRGVKAQEPQHRVGIQFTLDPNAEARKREQLARMKHRIGETEVDEIVLVTMPISHVRDTYEQWRYSDPEKKSIRKKLDPRGPDSLWPEEFKREIVDRLVRGAAMHA